ncbi:MAG: hypothetical protein AABN34_12750 [Acidobacteriota bacterium]
MKLIRLFSIVSMVMISVPSSIALAQDLSATRPRRVEDLNQQRRSDEDAVRLAYNDKAAQTEASPTMIAPWVQLKKKDVLDGSGAMRPAFGHFAATKVRLAAFAQDKKVQIMSPKSQDTVFGQIIITLQVRVDPSIKTLSVVVTDKNSKEVDNPDTKAVNLPRDLPDNMWRHRIQLASGKNIIKVIGSDGSTGTVGSTLEDSVDIVQQGDARSDDERDTFEASAYIGYAVDTFAAGDLRRYLNPNDSGGVTERFVGGFDFGYRLIGHNNSKTQLWVYGETVHGVRSADVDCKANPELDLCKLNLFNPNNIGQATLAILRNATSLEAFTGLRWEFATIQKGDDSAARMYLKGQLGLLTVAGGTDDVIDVHHIGLGVIATKGRMSNSYLEFGIGRTDLFVEHRHRRFKVDGFLSWKLSDNPKIGWMRPFAQITLDSDFGKGADSIQSYFGIDFELSALWGKKPAPTP